MIRETVETPVTSSQNIALMDYCPEPAHNATAIIEALRKPPPIGNVAES